MSSEVPLLLCSPTSDDRPGGEETSLLLGVMTSGRSRIPVGEREEGGREKETQLLGRYQRTEEQEQGTEQGRMGTRRERRGDEKQGGM